MTAHRMRTRLTRVASIALTTVMALSLVASASITVDAAKSEKAKSSKLGPHDLDLIAAARARGESTITLLIASSKGRNSSVSAAVAGLGGAIRYRDDGLNTAFGAVSVTDANALRPSGASWTVPGSVTANAAPAAGRVLYGNVQVRTDTDVLVGTGDVIVEAVTP